MTECTNIYCNDEATREIHINGLWTRSYCDKHADELEKMSDE